MVTKGDLTLSGEHTMQYTDKVSDGHLESLTKEGQIGFDKATRDSIGSGERRRNREEYMWKSYKRKYLSESQELKYYKFG